MQSAEIGGPAQWRSGRIARVLASLLCRLAGVRAACLKAPELSSGAFVFVPPAWRLQAVKRLETR
jgi:hypothetical protein